MPFTTDSLEEGMSLSIVMKDGRKVLLQVTEWDQDTIHGFINQTRAGEKRRVLTRVELSGIQTIEGKKLGTVATIVIVVSVFLGLLSAATAYEPL